MPVLSRSALESSPLADLHAIAGELGLDGFRRLRKAELVDRILERQGGGEAESGGVEATGDGETRSGGGRRRRGGRGRSRRQTDENGATDEDGATEQRRQMDAGQLDGLAGVSMSGAERRGEGSITTSVSRRGAGLSRVWLR